MRRGLRSRCEACDRNDPSHRMEARQPCGNELDRRVFAAPERVDYGRLASQHATMPIRRDEFRVDLPFRDVVFETVMGRVEDELREGYRPQVILLGFRWWASLDGGAESRIMIAGHEVRLDSTMARGCVVLCRDEDEMRKVANAIRRSEARDREHRPLRDPGYYYRMPCGDYVDAQVVAMQMREWIRGVQARPAAIPLPPRRDDAPLEKALLANASAMTMLGAQATREVEQLTVLALKNRCLDSIMLNLTIGEDVAVEPEHCPPPDDAPLLPPRNP